MPISWLSEDTTVSKTRTASTTRSCGLLYHRETPKGPSAKARFLRPSVDNSVRNAPQRCSLDHAVVLDVILFQLAILVEGDCAAKPITCSLVDGFPMRSCWGRLRFVHHVRRRLTVPAKELAAHKRCAARLAYANVVGVRQLLQECRCLLHAVVVARYST
jgi:hypothetical protein